MIKVSHETPIALLEESKRFNDYDYCLVHLLDKEPEYLSFFERSLAVGRQVILDNSLYELGKAFDSKKFAGWVTKLASCAVAKNQLTYVVPDVFNDGLQTAKSAKDFLNRYPNLPGKKMIVPHGTNLNELITCYKEIYSLADIIGIPFGSASYVTWFDTLSPGNTLTDEQKKTYGRQLLLDMLYHGQLLKKPIHLLGCNLPTEFGHYKGAPYEKYIDSLDTSSPVLHGLLNIPYIYPHGLKCRSKTKIIELLNVARTQVDIDLILHNVRMFKELNGMEYNKVEQCRVL